MNQKYKFFPNAATGFLSDEDTKKYFSRLGFAVFGLIVASSVVSTGLFLLYSQLVKNVLPWLTAYEMLISNIISIFSIYCIGVPIFLIISDPLPKVTPFKAKMDIKSWFGGFCIAMLFLTIGNSISSMILISIESMMNITTTNPVGEMVENSDIWTTLIFTVIIAPILEEIFFRKIVCDKLLPLGEGYAILISAAIFGLVHGNFYQFFYCLGLGLILAYMYHSTGRLLPCILLHAAINLVGSVVPTLLSPILEAIEGIDPENMDTMAQFLADNIGGILAAAAFSLFVYAAMAAAVIIPIVMRKKIKLGAPEVAIPRKRAIAIIVANAGAIVLLVLYALEFGLSLIPV